MKAILATTYFGPVQWYQKLNRFGSVLIEQHEHFLKQTFRNRCIIATTQGVQALTVPVEKTPSNLPEERLIKDVRISNHGKWRSEHWNALQSAYGESPFFEYYEDDIRPFFEDRWEYLFDFNMAITEKMCELLDIHPHITLTESYQNSSPKGRAGEGLLISAPLFILSIRSPIQISIPNPTIRYIKSCLAFSQTFPFSTSFNMGNEAVLYL